MMWANLNLLFWLSLIPFATGWMGENHFAPNSVALYGVLLLLSGLGFVFLQKAVEHNAHDLEALHEAFQNMNRKGIISTLSYTISIPLAYVNTSISGALFIMVAIIWLIPDKHIEKALRKENKF